MWALAGMLPTLAGLQLSLGLTYSKQPDPLPLQPLGSRIYLVLGLAICDEDAYLWQVDGWGQADLGYCT